LSYFVFYYGDDIDFMIATQLLNIFDKLSVNAAYVDYKDRARFNQQSTTSNYNKSLPVGSYTISAEVTNVLKKMKVLHSDTPSGIDSVKENDVYWPVNDDLLLPISQDVFLPTPPPFGGEDENSNPTVVATEPTDLTDEALYEKVLLSINNGNDTSDDYSNTANSITGPKIRSSGRTIASEKSEMRKKWQVLIGRIGKLWGKLLNQQKNCIESPNY